MLRNSIKSYLDDQGVDYKIIPHSTAYTASQTAQSAHIPGKQLAKVVVVKVDGELTLVAIPANKNLDLDLVKDTCHCQQVELAREYEFSDKFHDCDAGAMPPFGDLYGGMPVLMAESLTKQQKICCNGGTHSDLLELTSEDFLALTHPTLLAKC